jgi:hypothetical protein
MSSLPRYGHYVIKFDDKTVIKVYASQDDDVAIGHETVVVYQKGMSTYYPWRRIDSITYHEPKER